MDLEGNFMREFDSIKAAATHFGNPQKHAHNIRNACLVEKRYKPTEEILRIGKRRTSNKPKSNIAYGYKWKYKEEKS